MAFGFRLLPVGLEEVMFKRIPEGWLFTTSCPWLIGPRRTYIVSDAQKPAIAERVRRSRIVRLILVLFLVPPLLAVYIKFPVLRDTHAPVAWLLYGLITLTFSAIIGLSDYLNIRPLLRGVPRTTQKIRASDMFKAQSRVLSTRALAIFTAIFVLGALSNIALALNGGSAFCWVAGGGLIVFAIVFGGTLVAKLRAKPGRLDA